MECHGFRRWRERKCTCNGAVHQYQVQALKQGGWRQASAAKPGGFGVCLASELHSGRAPDACEFLSVLTPLPPFRIPKTVQQSRRNRRVRAGHALCARRADRPTGRVCTMSARHGGPLFNNSALSWATAIGERTLSATTNDEQKSRKRCPGICQEKKITASGAPRHAATTAWRSRAFGALASAVQCTKRVAS
jgi:hypothetical protein